MKPERVQDMLVRIMSKLDRVERLMKVSAIYTRVTEVTPRIRTGR